MFDQYWFLKNRKPITAGRRGLSIFGQTLSNPLKFALVHWWGKIVRPFPAALLKSDLCPYYTTF